MAVAYDNSAGNSGNSTTATVNLLVAANTQVFVGVHFNGGPTASSPTFEGNAMTLVDGPVNDVYLYRYANTTSGTKTASVTRSDSGLWAIGAVAFTGVDGASPIGTAVNQFTDETSPSESPAVTSGSTDWIILDVMLLAADAVMAEDAAQTDRVLINAYDSNVLNFGMSTKPGSASTTTMAWTTTGSIFGVGQIAVPIRPAAAAAGQPTVKRWGGVPHMGGRKRFGSGSGGGAWGMSKSGLVVPSRFREAA